MKSERGWRVNFVKPFVSHSGWMSGLDWTKRRLKNKEIKGETENKKNKNKIAELTSKGKTYLLLLLSLNQRNELDHPHEWNYPPKFSLAAFKTERVSDPSEWTNSEECNTFSDPWFPETFHLLRAKSVKLIVNHKNLFGSKGNLIRIITSRKITFVARRSFWQSW